MSFRSVSGDVVEFDLQRAFVLGGCAFEAYNTPNTATYRQTVSSKQHWQNGTDVTFVNRDILSEVVDGILVITVKSASNLPIGDTLSRSSDPYLVVHDEINHGQTKTVHSSRNPTWDDTFTFYIRDAATAVVQLRCYDEDAAIKMGSDDLLCTGTLSVANCLDATEDAGKDIEVQLTGVKLKEHEICPLRLHVRWLSGPSTIDAFAGTVNTANTESYLEKLQTNGDSFKQLLQAAHLAADIVLAPVMYFDNPETSTQAWVFICKNSGTVCLAFRGTEEAETCDFLTDANLFPWSYNIVAEEDGRVTRKNSSPITTLFGTWVHSGFFKGYDSVKDTIIYWLEVLLQRFNKVDSNPCQLWITGHSLGGALATLCANELAFRKWPRCTKPVLTMYNFGSPRVGNAAFVRQYNQLVPNSWRIVNHKDVVATVPQMLAGYRHVGHKVKLDTGGKISYKVIGDATVDCGSDEEVDSTTVVQQLSQDFKATAKVTAMVLRPSPSQTEDDVKGFFSKASARMATLWNGSAISEHMEDRYLANMKDVFEQQFGSIPVASSVAYQCSTAGQPTEDTAGKQEAAAGLANGKSTPYPPAAGTGVVTATAGIDIEQ